MSPTLRKLCPACKVVLIASPTRRCPACSRAYDQRRGTPAQRGYDGRHRAWRKVILATYDACVDCGAPGQADDHADHVVALAAGGDWSLENGVRRCPRCHGRRTALLHGGFGRPIAKSSPGGSQRPSRVDATGAAENYRPPLRTGPLAGPGATDVGAAYAPEEDHGG
jgi:5-methylcytosine-specific restriction protein A